MRRLAFVLLAALPLPSAAQERVPDLSLAFEAAESGNWDVARARAAVVSPVARDLVQWMRLRDGQGSFDEYLPFLETHDDWPGLDRAQARAEEQMPRDLPATRVLAFFDGREPQTGQGVVALARALTEEGQEADAEALVVEAWRDMALTESGHAAMISAHPVLLGDHHWARTDMLLWRWRTSDAERMLALLDDDHRALARARIALIGNDSDLEERLEAVPAALRDTPGLLYDRFNWLADRGRRDDAVEILAAQSTSLATLGEPFRWSGWRRSLARWMMREGDARQAYRLAANHFLTEGESFADLEWLAGYIALRELDQTDIALLHFQTMERAVEGPISKGRAWYWIGRAHEARGDTGAAEAAFAEAAQYQTGFYGLLAADRLGLPLDPALTGREDFPGWEESGLGRNDLVEAGLMLLEARERGLAVLFFARAGEVLDRNEIGALGARLDAMDEEYFEVLLGKSAAARGLIVPSAAYPIHGLSDMTLPVEPALALAIARQESEFRPDAGSSVGALGLMQLMPATAQEVAVELDLPYSRGRLTSDWPYNATLGSRYLFNLRERFGPSPVMIAAGYNAGPSRPALWMDENGDPREGEIEIVDWIERIPFRETRNYVQRVTEAIPIYRARLSGEAGEIGFEEMLRGRKPVIRPRLRPEAETPVSAEAPSGEEAATPGETVEETSAATPDTDSAPEAETAEAAPEVEAADAEPAPEAETAAADAALEAGDDDAAEPETAADDGVTEFAPTRSIPPEARPAREVRVNRGVESSSAFSPAAPEGARPLTRPSGPSGPGG